jgi:uncharacterized repeat protein (TIGR03803 family)
MRSALLVTLLAATAILPAAVANASATTIIYSFQGGADGFYADTDLALDPAGNLYGTTVQGGDFGSGTVWRLHPNGDGSWTHTVLYSFTGGTDGAEPYKGVTLDGAGNLYGTAVTGGGGACEGGCGVAYRLANAGGTWTETVIHPFTGGDDGSGPGARLTLDDNGTVYGMAPTGGTFGAGTIYEMKPGKRGYTFKVIHPFTGGADGAGGSAGALVLHGGNLYGAATSGGSDGEGTVYALTRKPNGGWAFHLLYAFQDQPDGGFPYGGLTFDALGNIYGTTYYAGANDVGAVYELSPHKAGWNERLLYSFRGYDGASPIGNVSFDGAGNIYGTASSGGSPAGFGVIFKLVPGAHRTWKERVAHAFAGAPDGALPYNGMVSDGQGHFFGATTHGGASDNGAIYRFTP